MKQFEDRPEEYFQKNNENTREAKRILKKYMNYDNPKVVKLAEKRYEKFSK